MICRNAMLTEVASALLTIAAQADDLAADTEPYIFIHGRHQTGR